MESRGCSKTHEHMPKLTIRTYSLVLPKWILPSIPRLAPRSLEPAEWRSPSLLPRTECGISNIPRPVRAPIGKRTMPIQPNQSIEEGICYQWENWRDTRIFISSPISHLGLQPTIQTQTWRGISRPVRSTLWGMRDRHPRRHSRGLWAHHWIRAIGTDSTR